MSAHIQATEAKTDVGRHKNRVLKKYLTKNVISGTMLLLWFITLLILFLVGGDSLKIADGL